MQAPDQGSHLKEATNLTRIVVVLRTCLWFRLHEGDVTSRHRVWLFRSNEIGFVTA